MKGSAHLYDDGRSIKAVKFGEGFRASLSLILRCNKEGGRSAVTTGTNVNQVLRRRGVTRGRPRRDIGCWFRYHFLHVALGIVMNARKTGIRNGSHLLSCSD